MRYAEEIMKKIIFIILNIFFLCFSILTSIYSSVENSAEIPLPLSLKDAVDIALINNKDIQIREEEIRAARSDVLGAKSGFLPKIDLNTGYTHNSSVIQLPPEAETQMDKDLGVYTGYQNDIKLGVSLNESIYNGGADFANLHQAKLRLRIQEESLMAMKLDVKYETKRLYYGLLLAYETERITSNLVNQAKAHYEDVRKKYEEGTSSRFDVLQSKVQVSKLIPQFVKAGNSVQLIEADLKKLLGLKMKDKIRPKDSLAYNLIEIREEEFLKYAYSNNPEMALKLMGVDVSKWSIELARAGNLPQVGANAGYNCRSDSLGDIFDSRHNIWNAGITVSINIFDGFSTKAKVDAAKAKYDQSNLEKEDLIDQIAVNIKSACLDLREAQEIIDSQKDNIEEAGEALRIAEISYDNGVGTNLDVLDAQVSLSQIEENLSEGIYDYLMAEAYLDRVMGREI